MTPSPKASAADSKKTSIEGRASARPPEGSLDAAWQALQGERAKIDDREQDLIQQALRLSGGVVAQAARVLGVARTTLASRVEALGMRPPRKDRQEP